MTQIYVDHHLLAKLAGISPAESSDSEEYLEFLDKVRKEVLALSANHRQVIIMYYFECREIEDIAAEMKLHQDDIRRLLRVGLLQLKHSLTDLVAKRWPNRFKAVKKCRICSHPRRRQIELILNARKPTESWGKINTKMKKQIGCSFNPPSVMISHLKYHMKE